MKQPVQIGIIGCGHFASVHCEALKGMDTARLSAFADIDVGKAEELRDKYDCNAYTSDNVERIFKDPQIDAVYICTQHDTHAGLCVAAARHGKHVMVEKPLALTVEDCRRVEAAVLKYKITLMPAFKMRFYPMVLKAKELIPSPLMITMQMMDDRWRDDLWPNDPVKGGGNIISQGCHSCDLLSFMAGAEPENVFAQGGCFYSKTGVPDNIAATFRFANGCVGSWVQGDAHSSPSVSKFFLQLFSEGKSVALTHRLTRLTYSESGKPNQYFCGTESGVSEENRAFINALRTDLPPPVVCRDGLRATLMPLRAFRSIETNQAQAIW